MYNPPVIANIVEIYIDEILFFYSQRAVAIHSPGEFLPDLLELDERLEAQLDGLIISGQASLDYCLENFEFKTTEEVFTAMYAALGLNDVKTIDHIIGICGDKIQLLDAVADAYFWHEYSEIEQKLIHLIESEVIQNKYIAIRVYTGHEKYSDNLSDHLIQALESDTPSLIQVALYAIGKLGLLNLQKNLLLMIEHENEDVRFAALYSATRFGSTRALESMKAFVAHPDYGDLAFQFVTMQEDVKSTLDILKELYQDDSTKRRSIEGLGYMGNPQSIPRLIQLMKTPELVRIAGSALSTITGIDFEQMGFTTDGPEDFATENPEDESIERDPDLDLPWLDVDKLSSWWSAPETKKQYSSASRYLYGKPKSKEQLQLVLCSGNQKQRLFCASYLSVYEHHRPVFNCSAPAKRQKKILEFL